MPAFLNQYLYSVKTGNSDKYLIAYLFLINTFFCF